MDIQLEKLELIKRIAETNDFSIIEAVKNIFTSKKKKDFWDELTEEQKLDINLSLKEFDEGKFSDFEEFILPYLGKREKL
jgi:hypothetical protein